jgi:hypothetical protein
MKKELKKRTQRKAEALSMKEKIKIQERIAKWEFKIQEKEEAMAREMELIEERNTKPEVNFIVRHINILRCRTNKTNAELNFEKKYD